MVYREYYKIRNDSFYIRPMVVRYNLMSTDTLHYSILQFTLADIFAMPKKGVQIDYINGRFQITTSGGHVHWYWVKSGWVFKMGGAGYIMLNIINSLIQKDPPFATNNLGSLGIAAGFVVFGELLKLHYSPTLPIGKKYHLQAIKILK